MRLRILLGMLIILLWPSISVSNAQMHGRWASGVLTRFQFDPAWPSEAAEAARYANWVFWIFSGTGLSADETSLAPAIFYWENTPECACVGETYATHYGSIGGMTEITSSSVYINSFHYNSSHVLISMPGSFWFHGDPFSPFIFNQQYDFHSVLGHEWGHFWGLKDNPFGGVTCAMFGTFSFGDTRYSCAHELSQLATVYFGP